MAHHAVALAAVGERLPNDIVTTRTTLTELERSLRTVAEAIGTGRGVVERLDAGWKGVATEVDEISRAARSARVLAVNASIEAAYVDAGSGFGIVADRMRALSASTLDSARDVRSIVGATRTSAAAVITAVDLAVTSCESVADALVAAVREFEAAGSRTGGFVEAVSRIAAIADEQRAAAEQIAGSVERLGTLAADAAAAARQTSRGIGEGVEQAQRAIAGGGDDALGDAVQGLTMTAIAAARGGVAWRGVDEALDALAAEFAQVAAALEESAHAAGTLDAAAGEAAATLAQLDRLLYAAADAFTRAAAEVREAHDRGVAVRGGIVAMHAATDRAGAIVDAVSEISAESGLLAINAAIEAARAGDRGRGFTVIADEIGHLARATETTAEGITKTIGSLRARGERFERASAEGASEMDAVQRAAARGAEAVEALRATIAESVERSRSLADTARVLAGDAQTILNEVAAARDALANVGRDARERARLTLSDLLSEVYRQAEEAGLDSPVTRLHAALEDVAVEIEGIYAGAIAAGRIAAKQLHDTDYVELRGDEVRHLARFVDVRTAPRDGFTPPKYRTSYDAAIDCDVMAVMDRALAEQPLVGSMALLDLNGLQLVTPSRFSTITDWTRNRAKRFLEDPIIIRVARLGLGKGAEGSGRRRPYAAFDRDGYVLRRVTPRPWAANAYVQVDTGVVFLNIAVAIYVENMRVATVTFIIEADRLERV